MDLLNGLGHVNQSPMLKCKSLFSSDVGLISINIELFLAFLDFVLNYTTKTISP